LNIAKNEKEEKRDQGLNKIWVNTEQILTSEGEYASMILNNQKGMAEKLTIQSSDQFVALNRKMNDLNSELDRKAKDMKMITETLAIENSKLINDMMGKQDENEGRRKNTEIIVQKLTEEHHRIMLECFENVKNQIQQMPLEAKEAYRINQEPLSNPNLENQIRKMSDLIDRDSGLNDKVERIMQELNTTLHNKFSQLQLGYIAEITNNFKDVNSLWRRDLMDYHSRNKELHRAFSTENQNVTEVGLNRTRAVLNKLRRDVKMVNENLDRLIEEWVQNNEEIKNTLERMNKEDERRVTDAKKERDEINRGVIRAQEDIEMNR
jgi:hypothetical protein